MIRLLRTILYVPADKPRAIEKARTLPVDAVILDLEDAVAPSHKEEARRAAIAAVKRLKASGKEVAVRINAPDTPWYNDDISEVRRAPFDGLVLPKVKTAIDVKRVALRSGMCVWPMMETSAAILEAKSIAEAAASSGPAVLLLGINDLGAEIGLEPSAARGALGTVLQLMVLAAKAAGIDAIDGVCNMVRDDRQVRQEARAAKVMGFSGKTVIHPSQIESVNLMFSPRASEVEEAEEIVAAMKAAEEEGSGVATLNGVLVEQLHARAAQRVIATAAAVEAAENAFAEFEATEAAAAEAAATDAEAQAASSAEAAAAEAQAAADAEAAAAEAQAAGDAEAVAAEAQAAADAETAAAEAQAAADAEAAAAAEAQAEADARAAAEAAAADEAEADADDLAREAEDAAAALRAAIVEARTAAQEAKARKVVAEENNAEKPMSAEEGDGAEAATSDDDEAEDAEVAADEEVDPVIALPFDREADSEEAAIDDPHGVADADFDLVDDDDTLMSLDFTSDNVINPYDEDEAPETAAEPEADEGTQEDEPDPLSPAALLAAAIESDLSRPDDEDDDGTGSPDDDDSPFHPTEDPRTGRS